MRFTKMQGIGNDYVYVDAGKESIADPGALARKISDRHFGVGSDGLVLILPGEDGADFTMRMFNADGSEAEMCGNAARCVGKYVFERGLTDRTVFLLKTGGGLREIRLNIREGKAASVTVDMGAPELRPDRIPVIAEGDRVVGLPIEADGKTWRATCLSTGNPHCVLFLPEVEGLDLTKIGPEMEHHPLFPRRINTEFVQVISRTRLRMRVWERGAGETMACGTGACAVLAAAVLNGLTEREADITLNGGELRIAWDEKTGHLMMTGPAEFVFEGEWPEET